MLSRAKLKVNYGFARGRTLTLPPADDSVSLSSFGGEGWGEEAVTPGGNCCSCLP